MSEKVNGNSNVNNASSFNNKDLNKLNPENKEEETFLFDEDINTSKSPKNDTSIMGNLIEEANDLLFSSASASPVEYSYSPIPQTVPAVSNDASLNNKTIYELLNIKNERQNKLKEARNNFNAVFNGMNDNVKSSTLGHNYVKKNYENLLERENGLNTIQKTILAYTNEAVEKSMARVDKAEILLKNVLNEVPDKQAKISEYQYNLDIYNEIVRNLENENSDNFETQIEINEKIYNLKNNISDLTENKSEQEKKLDENMSKIAEIIGKKDIKKSDESTIKIIFDMLFLDNDNKELSLSEEKAQFQKLYKLKTKLEKDYILNNKDVSPRLKEAYNSYKSSEYNLQKVKMNEASIANEAIIKAEAEYNDVYFKINQKNAERVKEDNKIKTSKNKVDKNTQVKPEQNSTVNPQQVQTPAPVQTPEPEKNEHKFKFDFNEDLSSSQKNELKQFKKNYKKNENRYKKVEAETEMPAELVAAIHWRESSGDFSTYLHNGQKLGRVTTLVPKGIYFGTNEWKEAAVDSLIREGCNSVDTNNINSLLDFAERFNGLGYRYKGIPSPYVWAGTDRYECGKYVDDGVFDPDYVDKQLGVAVMMKSICA